MKRGHLSSSGFSGPFAGRPVAGFWGGGSDALGWGTTRWRACADRAVVCGGAGAKPTRESHHGRPAEGRRLRGRGLPAPPGH
eukprot:1062914-Alexandrium_andersonii.AAC.1